MKKKSFFEKMGLVERVDQPDQSSYDYEAVAADFDEPEITVNAAEEVTQDLIGDIYASNYMSDMSRSVFKVEEVSKSLPDTMPKATKRTAVIGILASFNLTVVDIKADAAQRRNVIQQAATTMMHDHEDVVHNLEAKIEEMRKQIESFEAEIKDNQDKHAFIRQASEAELQRIDALVDFLSEDEASGKENA
jgi:cell division protein FtsL